VGGTGFRARAQSPESSRAGTTRYAQRTGRVGRKIAGIPWLRFLRKSLGERVHFWPFDGWKVPPGKSAVVEVYPALWSHSLQRDGRDSHQQDAYAAAEWLRRSDLHGSLERFLNPSTQPSISATCRSWSVRLGKASPYRRHRRSAANPVARRAPLPGNVWTPFGALLDLCVTEADTRRRRKPLSRRAAPSPTTLKSARPRGGAITEWYKGKTCLPVWRQISVEICRQTGSGVSNSRYILGGYSAGGSSPAGNLDHFSF
jgi:hypothetical protein